MPADLRHIRERTPVKNIAGSILALIGNDGRKVKRKELSDRLGIPERTVRANIAYLNENNYPIISSGNGFFYAQDALDFENAIERLEAERDNIGKRIEHLQKMKMDFMTREAGGGQLSMIL